MRATIIVDLGFGDAGKGHLTDSLVRRQQAEVVVRYNGGAQAGHNVVTPEGRHHTFSQFGSGTFVPNVKTFLSRYVVIHPGALLIEGEALRQKGVSDVFSRLIISDQALVITPYHQAANRIRELVRAEARHGSCGTGVGETIEDCRDHPEAVIRAGDLNHPDKLLGQLDLVRNLKRSALIEFCGDRIYEEDIAREWQIFESQSLSQNWIHSIAPITQLKLIAPDSLLEDWLSHANAAVFEGAQGMLIDAEHGFYPYLSWTNCSTVNAMEILQILAPQAETQTIGITRCYAVRHGPGPLPTFDPALEPLVFDHNQSNPWQGGVRYGWLDAVLTRYALLHAGPVDSLAVTHLDLLPKLEKWKICNSYTQSEAQNQLDLPAPLSREQKKQKTAALLSAQPVYSTFSPTQENIVKIIEELIGKQITFVSSGLTHQDVHIVNNNP